MSVAQGMHVRAILIDPCAYLISPADGTVTRDEDVNIVGKALEQLQSSEVVLNRIRGAQVRTESGCQKACRRRREPRAPR